MMHYRKGENIEQEVTKEDLPFDDFLPKEKRDFLWMQVKGGTKVSNVMTYAKNALEKGEYRSLVWSGSGGGVVKTVSCAEILRRSFPLYQVTRMCYTNVEEHWTPQMEGLEEIVANRQTPCLHIYMSLDELDVEDVQKPNTTTEFWSAPEPVSTPHRGNGPRPPQQRQQQQSQKRPNRHQRPQSAATQQQQQQQRQQPAQQTENSPQQPTTSSGNKNRRRSKPAAKRTPQNAQNTSEDKAAPQPMET